MPAELLDGTAIALAVRAEVAREVEALTALGVIPGLAVVLVGDDPASAVYVAAKGRGCDEAGIYSETIQLPDATCEADLLALLDDLNQRTDIHGILVQSPFPRQISADAVIRRIDPAKDVDGFHPLNMGKLLIGDRDGFIPCTPAGVREMLIAAGVETSGRHCVVVGRSNIVGKPMAALMLQDDRSGNSTVTICHRFTEDLPRYTRSADILITAVGRANLITADMVKPGAVVVDVGMNRIADASRKSGTRLVGDVDFDAVRKVASLITPVPGGVGPMTIALLLRNTVRSAARMAEAGVA